MGMMQVYSADLFAALRPISIILIYTLGRAWFNSCFWWSIKCICSRVLRVKLFVFY
jgi:hypothetical protein